MTVSHPCIGPLGKPSLPIYSSTRHLTQRACTVKVFGQQRLEIETDECVLREILEDEESLYLYCLTARVLDTYGPSCINTNYAPYAKSSKVMVKLQSDDSEVVKRITSQALQGIPPGARGPASMFPPLLVTRSRQKKLHHRHFVSPSSLVYVPPAITVESLEIARNFPMKLALTERIAAYLRDDKERQMIVYSKPVSEAIVAAPDEMVVGTWAKQNSSENTGDTTSDDPDNGVLNKYINDEITGNCDVTKIPVCRNITKEDTTSNCSKHRSASVVLAAADETMNILNMKSQEESLRLPLLPYAQSSEYRTVSVDPPTICNIIDDNYACEGVSFPSLGMSEDVDMSDCTYRSHPTSCVTDMGVMKIISLYPEYTQPSTPITTEYAQHCDILDTSRLLTPRPPSSKAKSPTSVSARGLHSMYSSIGGSGSPMNSSRVPVKASVLVARQQARERHERFTNEKYSQRMQETMYHDEIEEIQNRERYRQVAMEERQRAKEEAEWRRALVSKLHQERESLIAAKVFVSVEERRARDVDIEQHYENVHVPLMKSLYQESIEETERNEQERVLNSEEQRILYAAKELDEAGKKVAALKRQEFVEGQYKMKHGCTHSRVGQSVFIGTLAKKMCLMCKVQYDEKRRIYVKMK